MPLDNVNQEALEIVIDAAKHRLRELNEMVEAFEYDVDSGIGSEELVINKKREYLYLDTSIWMLEKKITGNKQ